MKPLNNDEAGWLLSEPDSDLEEFLATLPASEETAILDQLTGTVTPAEAEISLKDFLRLMWPVVEPASDLIPGWHIDALCDHLEAVFNGQIQNLIICVPPGSTKSLSTSIMLPAWAWIHRPETRFLYASHDQRLSTRDSVKCRRLVESPAYRSLWGDRFALTGDQNVKTYYENTRTGFRQALSTGAGSTGHRGDILVVDDAHSVMGVESEAQRTAVLAWYDHEWSNRVNDYRTSRRIVIGQRVHQQDLIGHLLEQGGYELLLIPEEFDLTRRVHTSIGWTDPRLVDGQLLRPERFGPAQVEEARKQMGTRGYLTQHQQLPQPSEGAEWPPEYFPPDIWFENLPVNLLYRVMALDPSKGKDSKFADYSAYVFLGLCSDNWLWVDADLARRPTPQMVEDGIELFKRWQPQAWAIETNAFQELLGREFQRAANERRLTLPMYGINNYVKKEVRIRTIGPYLAQKRLRFKGDSPGARLLVQQLKDFPFGEHEDGADSLEMAMRMMGYLLGHRRDDGPTLLVA